MPKRIDKSVYLGDQIHARVLSRGHHFSTESQNSDADVNT